MAEDGRVVTAKLPHGLVSQLDEVANRIDRSKSWILREALVCWLAEEQRRHELTIEALKGVDEGRVISQQEIDERVLQKKSDARRKPAV